MKITMQSDLAEVAACVARALSRAKIRAVLSGGACATLYSSGEYQSSDLDFVLQTAVTQKRMDAVMEAIGFRRAGDHYEHGRSEYFVEFPVGPLGIGSDIDIRPVIIRIGRIAVRVLSATDSCRDRLAAFFHWNDRQSLMTAARIATHRRVDLKAIRAWSAREGASEKFMEFLTAAGSARTRGRRGTSLSRRPQNRPRRG